MALIKISEDHFDHALISLQKPLDQRKLSKILMAIRKEIDGATRKDSITKLRKKGCLKQLVSCLQNQNEGILDVTLSILGNCCMDGSCARDLVRQHRMLTHISHILQHYKKDSICCRVFRIIGNTSQHWDPLPKTIIDMQPSIVDKIVEFLKSVCDDDDVNTGEEKASEATVIMAIRALRELVNFNTINRLVKHHGVLKAVGIVLIKYSDIWTSTKQHEEVLQNIIKLLDVFSKYQDKKSLLELQNTSKGNALSCLGNLILLSPYSIVKIIMNFMKVSTHRSDLPVVKIAQVLIENLQQYPDDNVQFRESLKCLCFLMHNPANKEEFRNINVLNILINCIKNCSTPSEITLKNCILILSTLKTYMFDQTSLHAMVKCGIVDILAEKLEWVVGSGTTVDTKHQLKNAYGFHECTKRRKTSLPCYIALPENYGLHLDIPSAEECASCWCSKSSGSKSPTLSEASFSSGPNYSPPASPAFSTEGDFDDSDSDDYSPVCSDAEEATKTEASKSLNESSCMETIRGDAQETDNNADVPENSAYLTLQKSLLDEIIGLLALLPKIRPVIPELGSERLLVNLLKCVSPAFRHIKFSPAVKLVIEIVECAELLLPLMQTNFIPIVYELMELLHKVPCISCINMYTAAQVILSNFTKIAESGRGKGDIAHLLLRANVSIKQKLIVSIPFIIKNRSVLGKLMLNCGGLPILLKLFHDSTDVRKKGIKGICFMATDTLRIKNPTSPDQKSSSSLIKLKHYEIAENCENVVTFKLDDGTHVQADRQFLIEKSDYFNRLLSGEFKESREHEVHLGKVTNKSLKCLLNLLHCDIKSTELHQLDADLDTLLEIIELTDRYLMEDLCVCVTGSVEQFKLSEESVPTIYQWSLESGTNFLRVEAIAYALVGTIADSYRYCMFQKLFDLGYTDQVIDDIQKLLSRYLSFGCNPE